MAGVPYGRSDEDLEKSKQQARRVFDESRENVKEEDVFEAADTGEKKLHALSDKIPKALKEKWVLLKDMVALVRAYADGQYKEVPWGSLAAVTAAVLYFVSPIDAIPDLIPLVGFIDDAAIIGLAAKLVEQDIKLFRNWRGDPEEEAEEEAEED